MAQLVKLHTGTFLYIIMSNMYDPNMKPGGRDLHSCYYTTTTNSYKFGISLQYSNHSVTN
jgi:hypothetical protein